MRCYKVTAVNPSGYIVGTRYASTNADIKIKRDELLVLFPALKKKDIDHEQIEVPLGKSELIDYFNELLIESDVLSDAADD